MWHTSGRGAYKQNSIHDFVSCAKYLVHEGYVRDDQLCSIGHSAGCLLVGAAINMYPGLFHAAIMKVSTFQCGSQIIHLVYYVVYVYRSLCTLLMVSKFLV